MAVQSTRLARDARAERRADARSRSPDDRRHRHPVARADGERRPPGGRGDGGDLRAISSSGRSRCSAAAATTAATASSSRARCCSAASTSRCSCIGRVADVRGDARINLEILGRLGADRRRDRRQPGVGAALLRGQRLHAHRRRHLRHRPERAARRASSRRSSPTSTRRGIPVVAIDLPSGLSADSPEPIGDSIEAGHDRHARRAEAAAGAAAGRDAAPATSSSPTSAFPPKCSTAVDGPRVELLTRERDARADRAARAPTRTRATTAACSSSPARAARPARRISRRVGALRSGAGPGHRRDAGVVPADRRGDGARVHDRGARRRRDDGLDPAAVDRRARHRRATSSRSGPGLGQARDDARRSSSGSSIARRCRWSSTPTASTRLPTIPIGCRAARGAT